MVDTEGKVISKSPGGGYGFSFKNNNTPPSADDVIRWQEEEKERRKRKKKKEATPGWKEEDTSNVPPYTVVPQKDERPQGIFPLGNIFSRKNQKEIDPN